MPESFNLDRLQTPIGTALLVTDADGHLRALDWEDYEARMKQFLRLHYGVVNLREARAPRDMRTALAGYFKGDLDRLATIEWRVAGTPFQQKVWNALSKIPPGTTLSYGALATKLEMPKAVRAVGHANGSNPISVVLPCHRLIGADGSLVKYGGGLERKRWLLQHEGVEVQQHSIVVPAKVGTHNHRAALRKKAVDQRAESLPPRRMGPGSRSRCSLVRDDDKA